MPANDVDSLDDRVRRFRLASRELFNQYFYSPGRHLQDDEGFALERRFAQVEDALFRAMVLEPSALPIVRYKEVQLAIVAEIDMESAVPIFINRTGDSGYWDHAVRQVDRGATMLFIDFFDLQSSVAYRDNQLVRVLIQEWPLHADIVPRTGLIDVRYIRFRNKDG